MIKNMLSVIGLVVLLAGLVAVSVVMSDEIKALYLRSVISFGGLPAVVEDAAAVEVAPSPDVAILDTPSHVEDLPVEAVEYVGPAPALPAVGVAVSDVDNMMALRAFCEAQPIMTAIQFTDGQGYCINVATGQPVTGFNLIERSADDITGMALDWVQSIRATAVAAQGGE